MVSFPFPPRFCGFQPFIDCLHFKRASTVRIGLFCFIRSEAYFRLVRAITSDLDLFLAR